MLGWRRFPRALRLLALLLAALLSALPQYLWPSAISSIEDRAADIYWRFLARDAEERRVVFVDIDEASLREVGPWPWSRETLADLIRRIHANDPAAQVLDIVLAEPRAGDEALAQVLSEARPVVAQLFSLDPSVTPRVGEVLGGDVQGCSQGLPRGYGFYAVAPTLARVQPPTGHISPHVDVDGVIRHLPTRVCFAGRAHPMLALAALSRVAQASGHEGPAQWRVHPSEHWWGPAAVLSTADLPGIEVPVDGRGYMRVPYGLARTAFVAISASDILRGQTAATNLLRGSIVLVGSTAFGMGDTVASPMSSVASGLEVHAQALVGVIDGSVPFTPARWPLLQLVFGAVICAALLLGGASRRGATAKRLPTIGVLAALILMAVVLTAMSRLQLWLPWFSLVLLCLLGASALAMVEHALARAQRERLTAHLGSYLPQSVAVKLMQTEPSGNPQFDPLRGGVLVCAIRNFQGLVSAAPAEELAAFLHAYTCLAVDVIRRNGGVVEQIVADTVIAFWPADDAHSEGGRSVAAARELLRTTAPLLISRRPVAEVGILQPLALGIGLEAGPILVGSYGPASRRAHLALGEAVNVAMRLQLLTADLSVPVLVGPKLAAELATKQVEPLGEYLLEGFLESTRLYALADWRSFAVGDPMWARSATGADDRQPDSGDWSRWGDDSPGQHPKRSAGHHSVNPWRHSV